MVALFLGKIYIYVNYLAKTGPLNESMFFFNQEPTELCYLNHSRLQRICRSQRMFNAFSKWPCRSWLVVASGTPLAPNRDQRLANLSNLLVGKPLWQDCLDSGWICGVQLAKGM